MAIDIRLVEHNFMINVTPPHGAGSTRSPLSATDALAFLSDGGVHSTDATDALDAADGTWRTRHDAEVYRRRGERA
jgi:hypothetical protein